MPINEQIRTILVKKPCLTQSSSSLSIHQIGNKHHSYSCTYCSKLFSSPSHLSRHILIHTGEKPCLCSECGQQFSQISSLERHQRTKHLKEKKFNSLNNSLYQCKLCHEYFSLKHNLKMHEKKLHQIQTKFFCHICSAYFTCNSSLQKHRNFRHRLLIKNQSSIISNDISMTTNLFNSSAISGSHSLIEERSSFFSNEISSVNSKNLFNNNNTNKQQVHYQILKCDEINLKK